MFLLKLLVQVQMTEIILPAVNTHFLLHFIKSQARWYASTFHTRSSSGLYIHKIPREVKHVSPIII